MVFPFDWDVEIKGNYFKDTYPEVAQHIALMHYFYPIFPENLESYVTELSDELASWLRELRNEGFDDVILKIIDPSYYATPISLIRLALADARKRYTTCCHQPLSVH